MTFPCRSKQRHNAGYQPSEGRIEYRFHPRFREVVSILRRQRFAGTAVFVIEQNDGTLAHIPCWMLDKDAGKLALQPFPRLSLGVLRDLRFEVSSLLKSLESEAPRMEVLDEAQTPTAAAAGSIRHHSADPSIAEQGEPTDTRCLSSERDPNGDTGKERGGVQ